MKPYFEKESWVCDNCEREEGWLMKGRHFFRGEYCIGTMRKVRWKGEVIE